MPSEAAREEAMETTVRAHVIISGRVQGVFFRVETKRAADGFGVFGWVINRRDRTVEAMFEGDQDRVEAVLEWCKEGPGNAQVSDVKVDWQDYAGEFNGFDITY
jgi:acylphosphatase